MNPITKAIGDGLSSHYLVPQRIGSVFSFAKGSKFFFIFLFASQCFSTVRGDDSEVKSQALSREIERFSRNEGYKFAQDLKNNVEWVDFYFVLQGIQDYISGKKLQNEINPEEEADFYRISFQLFELESKINLQKACLYLHELSNNTDSHTLENGKIIYKVVVEGQGSSVVQKDSAPLLRYIITTLNGLEIVNTRQCLAPYQVLLTETIPGFAKGIEGMRAGERRVIYIHPDFGYGKVGQVPPNSLLIADVEVTGLEKTSLIQK